MIWLEAAMAFCVVMMVLSTMVTVLVESFYHRLFKLRQRGMRQLVAALYTDVIAPRLQLETRAATGFTKKITTLRYMPFDKQLTGFSGWFRKHWHRVIVGREVQSLTALEFIARFADTEAGRALAATAQQLGAQVAPQYLTDFLDDVSEKFADYGNSTREYFAKRAQMVSVLLSIVLVLALNLNVVDVFSTVLRDDKVRQQLLAQSELVSLTMQRQQQATDAAVQQFAAATPGAAPDLTPTATKTAAPPQLSPEKSAAELQASMQQSLKLLQNAAIPMGAPWPDKFPELLERMALVIFSGLLVGLGGPFWFDTFRKLSSIAGVLRALPQAAAEVQPLEVVSTMTPLQVFQKALKVQQLAQPQSYAAQQLTESAGTSVSPHAAGS
ncbi:hypothetical protein A5320_03675 [Rheinheimera sp. SA_1]|uniref:hypothetical protein n=1 Tax=Rheinheimera sp. SA_1 TaxID=1827365 RepID=UPI00080239ED|nr:hypothetical protein [Rheinheimera sp. SA_1]OBP16515.1 hypothetical protein A5320_03675 [Rheinheimera sp. SA_1]